MLPKAAYTRNPMNDPTIRRLLWVSAFIDLAASAMFSWCCDGMLLVAVLWYAGFAQKIWVLSKPSIISVQTEKTV